MSQSNKTREFRLENGDLITLTEKVKQWHYDRNLIHGATDKDQYMKLIQEAGELSDNICKGNDIRDDIGDMMVVLINIAERNGVTLTACLDQAWEDIKDRKGTMRDGVFIKEEDNVAEENCAQSLELEPQQLDLDFEPKGFSHIYKNTVGGQTKY
jgi:uncharacterized protein YabN with tetrapyrrole methylase and pyrophosphatase domain